MLRHGTPAAQQGLPARRPSARWTPARREPENAPVTGYEFDSAAARPTDAERDRAVEALRAGAVGGRLSHDTFVRRMELALGARDRSELDALTADLTEPGGRLERALLGGAARLSALSARVRHVWRAGRLPALVLPPITPEPLRIGRDLCNGLRLNDGSVSRVHAELWFEAGHWLLRDLGSMNGTYVEGRRITGPVRVRPGDTVSFGRTGFRLTAPAAPALPAGPAASRPTVN
jgi:hypothetical protein